MPDTPVTSKADKVGDTPSSTSVSLAVRSKAIDWFSPTVATSLSVTGASFTAVTAKPTLPVSDPPRPSLRVYSNDAGPLKLAAAVNFTPLATSSTVPPSAFDTALIAKRVEIGVGVVAEDAGERDDERRIVFSDGGSRVINGHRPAIDLRSVDARAIECLTIRNTTCSTPPPAC